MNSHTAGKKESNEASMSVETDATEGKSLSDTHEPAEKTGEPKRPLAIDPEAVSASPEAPAFVARPNGAPPYYGFQVLEDTEVEGFQFGKITDFDQEPVMEGDGFVVAPDGSRAGLIWHISEDSSIKQFAPPEADRWGVWEVSFPNAMTSHENVRLNLACIMPTLKEKWAEWKDLRGFAIVKSAREPYER